MTRHQTRVRRATPADPVPGVGADERISGSENRNLPPELGTNAIAATEGRTFMYCDCAGDVPGGSIGGLVSEDTRLLSTSRLLINGPQPAGAGHRCHAAHRPGHAGPGPQGRSAPAGPGHPEADR